MHDFIAQHFTTANLFAVMYLVILEGILSVDNALALAALVKGRLRSEKDQQKALHYGIVGAYFFRVVVIFAGVWLMAHEWVKWVAASYLVYLGIKELFFKSDMEDEPVDFGKRQPGQMRFWAWSPLWSTIIQVELMDITFSVDSIAVALSVSDIPWVLIAGAVLGILAMRFTAQSFIKLITHYPILEKTAFVLVLLAGCKIIVGLLGYEVPETIFLAVMFATIGVSIAVHYLQQSITTSKRRST